MAIVPLLLLWEVEAPRRNGRLQMTRNPIRENSAQEKKKFEIQLTSRWDPAVPSLYIHFSPSCPWLNERFQAKLFLSTNLTFINSKKNKKQKKNKCFFDLGRNSTPVFRNLPERSGRNDPAGRTGIFWSVQTIPNTTSACPECQMSKTGSTADCQLVCTR